MHSAFKIAALNIVFQQRAFLNDPATADCIYARLEECVRRGHSSDSDNDIARIMVSYDLAVQPAFTRMTYMGFASMVVGIATSAFQASLAAGAEDTSDFAHTCPKCGGHSFNIDYTNTAEVMFTEDGDHEIVDTSDDVGWGASSHSECRNCGHDGPLSSMVTTALDEIVSSPEATAARAQVVRDGLKSIITPAPPTP